MTSDFKEDQAEQLRRHFGEMEQENDETDKEVDVLSLPSRKEKYNQKKQMESKKSNMQENKKKQGRKKQKIKFPIVRILLVLFLLLVVLIISYPRWIDRLNF